MRRSTKGQIQIAEILVVIFIFIIIFIFGLYAYMSYQTGQRQYQEERSSQLSLVEKMREIINFAEIKCSINGRIDQTCVDAYRVQSFSEIIRGTDPKHELFRDYYEERFFGYALNVQVVYPLGEMSGAAFSSATVFD